LRWIALSAAAARPAAFLLPRGGRRRAAQTIGRRVRARTPEDRRLLETLDPVAEAAGYEIVRLRLLGGARSGRTLQVMGERPSDGDMNVDDCARLSRALSDVLDAADLVAGEYRLEVSSPGVDRPLTRLKDFAAYEGYEARIELDRLAENRKRFKGVLAGVEGDDILIDLEGEAETAQVPFAWIQDAKLVLSDELLKRGAQARAARLEAEQTSNPDSNPDDEEDA
jgi:ribosome maturation factor RimP